MEIGPSQFDIAKTWCLKGPIHGHTLKRGLDGLTWVAQAICICIGTDGYPQILIPSWDVVVAKERKVQRGNSKAIKQRLAGKRQWLNEEIRVAAADIICGRRHPNVLETGVVQRGTLCHRHCFEQLLFSLGLAYRRGGQLWTGVALDTLAFIHKEIQSG